MRVRERLRLRELICAECGSVFPIQRRASRLRKKGHIKHLWCVACGARTAHVERIP